MKKKILPLLVISCINNVYATDDKSSIVVDKEPIELTMANFKPILKQWGNRAVITGYDSEVELVDTKSSLVFKVNGDINAKWFASNFTMSLYVTCSGIPIGTSKVYGSRVKNESIPASPAIIELRHNLDNCKQLKIELKKHGPLSRQFYTRIKDINFKISANSLNGQSIREDINL